MNILHWLKPSAPGDEIEIPKGPIRVHVQGEAWGLQNINKVISVNSFAILSLQKTNIR